MKDFIIRNGSTIKFKSADDCWYRFRHCFYRGWSLRKVYDYEHKYIISTIKSRYPVDMFVFSNHGQFKKVVLKDGSVINAEIAFKYCLGLPIFNI